MRMIYQLKAKNWKVNTGLFVFFLFVISIFTNQKIIAQTPLKQESGSLTTAPGTSTVPQVVTYFDGAAAYSPTTTVTYAFSNQQYGTGTTKPLEGMASLPGLLFGGNSNNASNTAPAGFPRNSLMNGISSPLDTYFKACAACAAGSIQVANDYAVGLQSLTDGFINSSGTNIEALNSKIYMGDLTITFNRPVSNPIFQFVGMGGFMNYFIDHGFPSGIRNYDMGWASEFELIGSDVTLSKVFGNAQLTVTGNEILNNATSLGNSSAGAALNGVTRYAASGSILAAGSNITSITLKVYIRGDGGRITNSSGIVAAGVGGRTPQWSLAPFHPTSSSGTVNSDVYLIGVTIQKPVSLTGNVFKDPNAGNVDNSSGGANLVPSGMFINLLDPDGVVVASVPVATNGTYTIPAIFEGTYTTSLTNSVGTVGLAPPAPSTPDGWSNTGEFTGPPATGNDGSPNGVSAPFTVAATNITNINYGIAQCSVANPITTATTLTNVCPATTVDLNSLVPGTPPAGAALQWFTNSLHTGIAYSPASMATAGTYYAFYYNASSACYSPASQLVSVKISPCTAGSCTPTNLIFNGDFEQGNVGFGAGFTYKLSTPSSFLNDFSTSFYSVIDDNVKLHPEAVFWGVAGDHTTPSTAAGNFLYANGGDPFYLPDGVTPISGSVTTTGAQNLVWGQTISGLTPGKKYTFSYWAQDAVMNWDPLNNYFYDVRAEIFVGARPGMFAKVDGIEVISLPVFPYLTTENINNWVEYKYSFVADADGKVVVEIFNKNHYDAHGNDFVIDDITLFDICPVNVSGNVFNDPNGGNVNNSTGVANVVPTGMFASLVDNNTGLVVKTVPVNADGSYNIPGVYEGNYKVVLSTTNAPADAAPPAPALPSGWVRTGDFNGAPNTGNTVPNDGVSANFAVTTTDVPNINFAIQQVPETAVNLQPSQVNPGGTTSVPVPAGAFQTSNVGVNPNTDDPTTIGTVTQMKIPTFPTGATSITIGGTTYLSTDPIWTSGGITFPYTDGVGPVPAISVDPLPGVGSVVIPIVAIDNLGNPDATPGSITLPFTAVSVSGNVFNDPNVGNVNNSSGDLNLVPAGMIAYLIKDGAVVGAGAPVATDGTFTFGSVNEGTGYTVVISTTPPVGTTPPVVTLPAGWLKTGEFNGAPDGGTDGTVDSKSAPFDVVATDVPNRNFGIQQPPTANIVDLGTTNNPGGAVDKDITSGFGGADPTTTGIVASLTVTSLPAGVTSITINGIKYGPGFTPFPLGGVNTPTNASGLPITPILIDPIDGNVIVTVPYVTIDNAGVTSPIPGEVKIAFETVSVSGNVFNDPNVGNVNNSSGDANLVPAGMTAYLVKDGAVVGASAPVATDGTFTFGNVPPGAGYTVVLSTTTPSGTTPPPSTLPGGWLKTGEFNGAPDSGTDGTVDSKSAPFDVISTNVVNRNFGIQQPPTANIVDLGTVPNPGGTTPKDVTSSFGGTDPTTNGIVSSLTVTSLPANVTSITINGIKYGPSDTPFPVGGVNTPTDANGVPTSPILIDPIDGDVVVVIPYVTIDNGGAISPIPGEVKVAFDALTVSGNVFNDPNVANVNNSSGDPNLVPAGMTAYLVKDGAVVGTSPVATVGTFSFGTVSPGTGYTVVISTTAPIGTTPPVVTLPTGWLKTGEFNGAPDSGTDATVDSKSAPFDVIAADVPNRNFGIQQPPTANIVDLGSVVNPGGLTTKDVTSSFGGADPTTNGIVASLTVTSLPANVTSITINGIKYGPSDTPFPVGGVNTPTDANGVPTSPILIDPIDGNVVVTIPYVTIDNAGVASPIPGEVKQAFYTVSVSGNVFNDPNVGNVNNSSGDPNLVPAGMTAYLVKDGAVVGAGAPVATDGTFTFGSVTPASGYTVVISTTPPVGTTPPVVTLPTGWLKTGEFNGAPDGGTDATVDSKSAPFDVVATDVPNRNFGIQQPPTANIVDLGTVPNPGGTITKDVNSGFGGTDPTTNGIIASLTVTSLPANVTSITINGIKYGPSDTPFPVGGVTTPTNASGVPTSPILIDPIDGDVIVKIPYVTTDNGGIISPIPGEVKIAFGALSVSGNVFNDPNAGNVNNSSGDPNVVPAGMTAYLVKGGVVVGAGAPVAADGSFIFGAVAPGTGYTVVLSTTPPVGTTPPASTLPAGWLKTGEFNGAPDGGTDGTIDSKSAPFDVVDVNVPNRNFGIQQPPTANIVDLGLEPNPGGTTPKDVTSSFGGADPTTNGIVSSLTVTSLPANVTSITINGIKYGPSDTPFPVGGVNTPTDANGVPTSPILIDPIDGNVIVKIPYLTIDNAGVTSPIPGEVKAAFNTILVSVSGNVFNDPNAANVNNSSGDPNLVPAGMTAYLVKDGAVVGVGAPVATDGTFNFPTVAAGTGYTVVISTTPPVGTTPPVVTLPTGWLKTGEFNGTPDSGADATIDSKSAPFDVIATDVVNRNFGIQQPPTANIVDLGSVPNPGGTNPKDVTSSFGGTDPTTNGIVASLTVTSLPANVTSITINGIKYGPMDTPFPVGGVNTPTDANGVPTTPILIDPMDGDVVVTIPYVTIDNAGATSPIPGEVKVAFDAITVKGNVFNDPNAGNVNNSSGDPNVVPAGMTAYLVKDGAVVGSGAPVASDGTFTFGTVPPATGYTVVLSTTAPVGTTPPVSTLPTGWLKTGEFNGASDGGTDATVDSKSAPFDVVATDVVNRNFGIQQPPTANIVDLGSFPNPGGTTPKDVNSGFGGADPTTNGIVSSLTVTSLPANVTSITINGIKYGPIDTPFPVGGVNTPTDANGVPTTTILIDPIDGDVIVKIPYVTIDNAGVTSPIPGEVKVAFSQTLVNVSGNVFNDPNAGNVNNSSGEANLVPAGMTAYLVKDGAVVGAGAPVATNGAFTFGNVAPGIGYTVVLSTTPPVGTTPPASTLPSGWLKTGEFNGAPDGGTDATVDSKSAPFDVVASDVVNRNFGIQQPPTANIVDLGSVLNPGGTTPKDVNSGFGGADPTTNGIVSSLTVTSLPANVTSITINGIKYGSSDTPFPALGVNTLTDANGLPITPILIDPIDGNVVVTIPYVTIDNAGVPSPIPGEVKIAFSTLKVNGNVFNDPNAGNVNNSTGDPNVVPAGMMAYLVKDGAVVGPGAPVATDGTFTIPNVTPGTGYTVVLSTTAPVGTTPPVSTLPTGWLKTGEFNGAPDGGTDATVDSKSAPFDVVTTDVVNRNFGIQQPPTANIVDLGTAPNPGGTATKDVASSFGGTDPTTTGIIASLTITSLPANVTSITINGIKYGPSDTPFPVGGVNTPTDANGVPTNPILIDPIDGDVIVKIPYVTVDNAGVSSPIPGEVKIAFGALSVSGNVFNDPNAGNVNNSTGDANVVPAGMTAYLVKGGVVVGAGTPVAADGTFIFGSVAPGTGYTVVLSTTPPVGTTPPASTLPTGWLKTGEFNGAPDGGTDATVDSKSAPFDVVAVNVVNRNFGIQQPPTANIVDLGTVPNPGGTTPKDVTSGFGGADPTTNGIVASLTITSLPANVTSITINGIKYGPSDTPFPVGGVNTPTDANGLPTNPILVDPIDGDVIVKIPYVTIDNAGVASPIPGEVKVAFDAITVKGNVFNDPNAGNVNNSSGDANTVPVGMIAYLVKDGAVVGAGAPVAADGTFTFNTVPPATGYTVVISTTTPVGTTPPVVTLPTGWLKTGEFNGSPDGGTDATVDSKSAPFDVVVNDVVNRNFGIQEPPTANVVDLGSFPNPGGTTTKDVNSGFGGADPTTNGIVSSLIVTSLPANVTSITINGIKYGISDTPFPVGGVNTPTNANGLPTSPILVDPIDGEVIVTIPYVTIDNAGVTSPIPGEVKVGFSPTIVSVSGNVFNDPNAGNVNNSSGDANLVPAGMTAYLVKDGAVVGAGAPVASNGAFTFGSVAPGTGYSVVLSTTPPVGTTPPVVTLPNGWLKTGEFNGAPDGGTDATVDSKSAPFDVVATNVENRNFGIQQPPTANIVDLGTVPNPSGTTPKDVTSSFSGADPTTNGIVSSITITSLPANVTSITINGIKYGPSDTAFPVGGVNTPTDANGLPITPILIDPIDGDVVVIIPYVTIDNAGVTSPIPGEVKVAFDAITVKGNVFNDPNAGNVNNSSGDANAVPAGMTAYLVKDGAVVGLGAPVAADGTFEFTSVAPGTGYTVVLSTTPPVGTTPPVVTLPAGWLKTGEFNGAPDGGTDGTVDSKSAAFDVVATDVVNRNFGIQEPPTANIADLGSVINPGGTTTKDVTSGFGGADLTTNGIVSSLTITSLPANVTSITINGIKYGPSDTPFPGGGVNTPTNANGLPTSPILIDPIDGEVIVKIPYVTVDNAGVSSPILGEVKVGFTLTPVTVSGSVFNDPNAGNVNNSSGEANVVPAGITAYLVKDGAVVGAGAPVGTDGTFTFNSVAPGTGYSVIISTTAPVGTTPPVVTLPVGWLKTGEFNGTPDSGTDGSIDGKSATFDVATSNVVDRNFGIQQPPTANIVDLGTTTNPAGTTTKDVNSSFGGTDPTTNGTISSLTITSLPANVTSITINGIKYGPSDTPFPMGGVNTPTDPTGKPINPILIDPIDGNVLVKIPYVTIDNAGITSPIPGEVKVLFTTPALPITLIDLAGKQVDEAINLTWKTANEKEFSHFELQRSSNAKEFGTIGTVKGIKSNIYNFVDKLPTEGINYYRLKMIDLDGTTSLSKIVNVSFEKGGEYITIQNPANNGEFNVRTNLKNPRFTLLTNLGQRVEMNVNEINSNVYTINANNTVSGIYYLNIVSDGKVITKKVLIP